jgi:hypothetical protein
MTSSLFYRFVYHSPIVEGLVDLALATEFGFLRFSVDIGKNCVVLVEWPVLLIIISSLP